MSEIQVKMKMPDGTIKTTTTSIVDGVMTFDSSVIPGPNTPTKELLGYGQLSRIATEDDDRIAAFISYDHSKLPAVTDNYVLIFTYANCFVVTPLSQTREARVPGNLVYDNMGNSRLSKVRIHIEDTIDVITDCTWGFGAMENAPIAYVFLLKF